MKPGQRFGPYYRVVARLGQGGMAEVYRALDTRISRPVALKVLTSERSKTHNRERFLRESQTASMLHHPNLMTVYEAGEVDGRLFLAAELIDGETLAARLREGPLVPKDAVEITCQLLRGLGAAHAAGVVHRDVKPPNIMIRRDGVVKLLDFGLAKNLSELKKLTRTGTLLGTPHYMSPEQVSHVSQVTPQSDLFAVGAILYEMLTGTMAFPGQSFVDVVRSIVESEPSMAGVPAALQPVLRRALAKSPEDRFPTAEAMEAALTGLDVPAQLPPPPRLLVRPFHAEEEDRSLADGLTWGLISRLFQVHGLTVIGRQSASRLGEDDHAGAHLALEGSLRREPDGMIARLSLRNLITGEEVWSRELPPQRPDLFVLEEQLVGLLLPGLSPWIRREQEALSAPQQRTPDPLLQQRYHEALHMIMRRGTPADMAQAAILLRGVVRQEPSFVCAQARLASVLEILSHLSPLPERETLLNEARAHAVQALTLDPDQVEAHLALAQLSCNYPEYDWLQARRLLRTAQGLAEEHPEVLALLALVENVLGHPDRTVELARRAVRSDPHYVLGYLSLTSGLAALGQLREAADAAERCLRLEPSCEFASAALLVLDYMLAEERALEYYKQLAGIPTDKTHPVLRAALLLFEGLQVSPERPLRELLPGPQDGVWHEQQALRLMVSLAGGRRETDKALELLENLLALNFRNLSGLQNDPLLVPLHGERRWEAICQDLRELIAQDA